MLWYGTCYTVYSHYCADIQRRWDIGVERIKSSVRFFTKLSFSLVPSQLRNLPDTVIAWLARARTNDNTAPIRVA